MLQGEVVGLSRSTLTPISLGLCSAVSVSSQWLHRLHKLLQARESRSEADLAGSSCVDLGDCAAVDAVLYNDGATAANFCGRPLQ